MIQVPFSRGQVTVAPTAKGQLCSRCCRNIKTPTVYEMRVPDGVKRFCRDCWEELFRKENTDGD